MQGMNADPDKKTGSVKYANADEDGNFVIPDITGKTTFVWKHLRRGLTLVNQVGIRIAVCATLGLFLGRLLDRSLNTAPVFVILLSLLGAGAAFKSIYDDIKPKKSEPK